MASKKNLNSSLERVDRDFSKDMREIARIRLTKGLARFKQDEISTREMTNLLRRTQGYRLSIEELKTKPKRKQ